MTTYKDLRGREWPCTMTFGTSERLRERLGIDLFAMLEAPKGADEQASDPIADVFLSPRRMTQVLWECIPEDGRSGVSFADFIDAIDGTVLDAASGPLMKAITGLFSDPTRRSAMERMFRRTMKIQVEIEAAIATKAEAQTVDVESLLQASGQSAGNGPESAA